GAAALSDGPLLVLPFITRSTTGALVILLCAFFLQGIGLTGCNVHVDSIRQALIPDRLQGRANASYRLLVSGALSVGALLGGFLGAWIGLQLTLLVGAVGLLSTWLWIVCSPIPRLRWPPTMTDEQGLRPLPLLQIKSGTENVLGNTEKAFIVPISISKEEVA
ncbi:MAG TPA: MFS transporter, partial [Ktedonobacteraceae bacterium]|nr:MFS transporter [Ktedonobacteraceae bacterium]